MTEWLGDWVVCPKCEEVLFENRAPEAALIPQHRGHHLLRLDRVYVTPEMTHGEAVAVAWVLRFDQDLRGKKPPEELSAGVRPQAWADARNAHLEQVSADIAVVYEEPGSHQLRGVALVDQGKTLREAFAEAQEAEDWLSGVMRTHGLNHCHMVDFAREHRAFWTGLIDCRRVMSMARRPERSK